MMQKIIFLVAYYLIVIYQYRLHSPIGVESEVEIKDIEINSHNLAKKMFNIKVLMRDSTNEISISEVNDFENNFCNTPCKSCKVSCKYKLIDLNPNKNLITKAQTAIELKRHNHPKSRRINGNQRTLNESLLELKAH